MVAARPAQCVKNSDKDLIRDGDVGQVFMLQARQIPDEVSSRKIPKFDFAVTPGRNDVSIRDCHSTDLALQC